MKTLRTSIDLPDSQIAALDELSKMENKSRAALIRRAIDDYLANRRVMQEKEAFGLWANNRVGGLAYQRRLRREW